MSQWANEHPEQMEEIARLPMREQNAALREAIGYDPDRVREEHEERIHHHRPLNNLVGEVEGTPPAGSPSLAEDPSVTRDCTNCGAPEGEPCQHWCHWEAIS